MIFPVQLRAMHTNPVYDLVLKQCQDRCTQKEELAAMIVE
jgi:hypothetical protein